MEPIEAAAYTLRTIKIHPAAPPETWTAEVARATVSVYLNARKKIHLDDDWDHGCLGCAAKHMLYELEQSDES